MDAEVRTCMNCGSQPVDGRMQHLPHLGMREPGMRAVQDRHLPAAGGRPERQVSYAEARGHVDATREEVIAMAEIDMGDASAGEIPRLTTLSHGSG